MRNKRCFFDIEKTFDEYDKLIQSDKNHDADYIYGMLKYGDNGKVTQQIFKRFTQNHSDGDYEDLKDYLGYYVEKEIGDIDVIQKLVLLIDDLKEIEQEKETIIKELDAINKKMEEKTSILQDLRAGNILWGVFYYHGKLKDGTEHISLPNGKNAVIHFFDTLNDEHPGWKEGYLSYFMPIEMQVGDYIQKWPGYWYHGDDRNLYENYNKEFIDLEKEEKVLKQKLLDYDEIVVKGKNTIDDLIKLFEHDSDSVNSYKEFFTADEKEYPSNGKAKVSGEKIIKDNLSVNVNKNKLNEDDIYIKINDENYLSTNSDREKLLLLFHGGILSEVEKSENNENVMLYKVEKDGVIVYYYDNPYDKNFRLFIDIIAVKKSNHSTSKGLRVGDRYERMIELYGYTEYFYKDESSTYYSYLFNDYALTLIIEIDNITQLVTSYSLSSTV